MRLAVHPGNGRSPLLTAAARRHPTPRSTGPGQPGSNASQAAARGLAGRPTWLKVLPLYTPTTEPIISGMMIMLRRWVRTCVREGG